MIKENDLRKDTDDPTKLYGDVPKAVPIMFPSDFSNIDGIKGMHVFMSNQIGSIPRGLLDLVKVRESVRNTTIDQLEYKSDLTIKDLCILHVIIVVIAIALIAGIVVYALGIEDFRYQMNVIGVAGWLALLLVIEFFTFIGMRREIYDYKRNMELLKSPDMTKVLDWEITKKWAMDRYDFNSEEQFQLYITGDFNLQDGKIVHMQTGKEFRLRKS